MTDNMRGIVLMVGAMAGFAVEDMFLKAAAQSVSPAVVMAVFGAGGGSGAEGGRGDLGRAFTSPSRLGSCVPLA